MRPAFLAVSAPLAYALSFPPPVSADTMVNYYEELPYFQHSDSPFFDRFVNGEAAYLEDFEDHALNTPNVVSWDVPRPGSLQIGRTLRFATGSGVPVNLNSTWSVDADDGLNGDFIGAGDTWTTVNASNGQILGLIQFRFEPDELGRYPTWVGFVVTEALDPFDEVEFATLTFGINADTDSTYDPLSWIPILDSFPGDTRTHRFFGTEIDDSLSGTAGFTGLVVRNVRQIDHLQYGYAPIPEPSPAVLLIIVATSQLFPRRR